MPVILDSQPVAPSLLLRNKLAALRRRHVAVSTGTGAALVVAVALVLVAIAMTLDWWLDLAWGARAALLAFNLGIVIYLLTRHVLHPILHPPEDDTLALEVEKVRDEFCSRLIASVQFTQPGGVSDGESAELVRAMVEETEALAQPIAFEMFVKTDQLKRVSGLALILSATVLLGFIAGGKDCVDLLKRAFLSNTPVPRKTRIVGVTGNLRVGRGDTITLEAVAKGVIPRSGRLVVKSPNRSQEFPLEPQSLNPSSSSSPGPVETRAPAQRGRFARTIANVQESFRYVIYLNDGASGPFRVEVIPRPTVVAIQCEQVYPLYTRLGAVKRSPGDLSLLAGSRLRLKATATRDIQRAFVRLVGLDREVPMEINRQNPKELSAEIPIPARGLTGFSIQMLDTDGMASQDAAVYRVDVIPDKAPAVRITYPDRKEELITKHATMIIGFEAVEDFQITRARIRYKLRLADKDESSETNSIVLDLTGENPQRLRRRYEWKIGGFNPLLAEGTTIEYWVEVEDDNNVTGPGIGSSEHQLARIVSENEKRADLLNRAGDYLGSISDVAADQEKLNQSLGALILEKVEK